MSYARSGGTLLKRKSATTNHRCSRSSYTGTALGSSAITALRLAPNLGCLRLRHPISTLFQQHLPVTIMTLSLLQGVLSFPIDSNPCNYVATERSVS